MTKWEVLKKDLASQIKLNRRAIKECFKNEEYSTTAFILCELQTLEHILNNLIPKIETAVI